MVLVRRYLGWSLIIFKAYPQRQKAASFNRDKMLEKSQGSGSSN